MKRLFKTFVLSILIFIGNSIFAQKHGHHPKTHKAHHHAPKKVIKKSIYRPAKVVVFHPHWGPKRVCHRRWVYFPKYNLYWDNWRNHFVFWNGTIWVSQVNRPAVIVNVNLDNEKQYEMKEDDDDTDDIYKGNDNHKTEYKHD